MTPPFSLRQLSVSGLGGVLSSAAFFEITCLLRCLPLGQRMPQCRVVSAEQLHCLPLGQCMPQYRAVSAKNTGSQRGLTLRVEFGFSTTSVSKILKISVS